MNADFLITLASILQIFASIAVIIGILFAIIQLKEVVRTRHLEVLGKTFEEFRSDIFFADRRFIYSHEGFDYDTCSDEDRIRIERLINTYNRIAFLVLKGLTKRELVLELYSGAFIASWQKLETYVIGRRIATGFSDWAVHFERMACLARDYRGKVLKEHEISYKVPLMMKTDLEDPLLEFGSPPRK